MPLGNIIVFSVIGLATYLAIGTSFLDESEHPSTKYEFMVHLIKLFFWPLYWPLLIIYHFSVMFFEYWKNLPDE